MEPPARNPRRSTQVSPFQEFYSASPKPANGSPRSYQGPFADTMAFSQSSSVYDRSRRISDNSINFDLNGIEDRYGATGRQKHVFKSYRLKGEYVQPWRADKRMKRTRYNNIIVWVFVLIGIALSGYIRYTGSLEVDRNPYCLILDDAFSSIDSAAWTHEVQINGFGTGSFDWDTDDQSNSFTDSEGLHIVPTLTTATTSISNEQLLNGYTLNLTKAGGDGTCTSTDYTACSLRSN